MTIFAFLAAAVSAIATLYQKTYLTKIDPLVLTMLRHAYIAIILICLFLFNPSRIREMKDLTKKEIFLLIAIGLLGGTLSYYLFFLGARLSGAYVTATIHKTEFIWVIIFSLVFLKEKFRISQLIGFVLIVIGSFYIMPIRKALVFGSGELLLFAAVFLWAVEFILLKIVLETVSTFAVGLWRFVIGSAGLLTAIFILRRDTFFVPINLDTAEIIVIGGTLVFFYIYFLYRALEMVSTHITILIVTTATAINLFIESQYFHFNLGKNNFYSALFIVCGAVILAFNKRRL